MFRNRTVDKRSTRSPAVIGSIGLISAVITSLVGPVPLSDVLLVRPATGIAVGAGVLFGGHGAIAVGVGHLIGRIVTGDTGPVTLAFTVTYVTVGFVSVAVWKTTMPSGPGDDPTRRLLRGGLRLAVTAGMAALSGAAVLAWMYELFGLFPFYVAPRFALSFGVSGFFVGGVLLVIAQFVAERRGTVATDRTRPTGGRTAGDLWLVGGIPLVWLIAGTIGSFGYRAFAVILSWDANAFAVRDLEWLLVLYDDAAFGVGGRRIQAVLGGVMFALLVLSVVRTYGTSGVSEHEPNDG